MLIASAGLMLGIACAGGWANVRRAVRCYGPNAGPGQPDERLVEPERQQEHGRHLQEPRLRSLHLRDPAQSETHLRLPPRLEARPALCAPEFPDTGDPADVLAYQSELEDASPAVAFINLNTGAAAKT
jgi:hypothetical protein